MCRQRNRQRAEADARITGATGDCVAAPRNRLAVRAHFIRCVSALMECCLRIPPPLPAVTKPAIFWCCAVNLLLSFALCKERLPMSSRPASTKRSLVPYEFAPAIPQHPDPITQRQKGNPARRGRGRAASTCRGELAGQDAGGAPCGEDLYPKAIKMQRLKRVFNRATSGSIRMRPGGDRENPGPPECKASSTEPAMLPEDRAPPQARLLD